MSSFSENFEILEKRVQQLIQQKKLLHSELESAKVQVEAMAKENHGLQEEIEELKEKNKILRIAGGAKEGDTREIKLKINEMVREVDKCIAQLNQ